MSSVADICNIALSHVGADANIASISPPDGSFEASKCAQFYPLARRQLLSSFSFDWTKTRVLLAQVDNPSVTWQYAYALPADCLDPLRVLQQTFLNAIGIYWFAGGFGRGQYDWTTIDTIFNEQGSALFEIEGGVLLTNEPEAVLLYKRDIEDTSQFSPNFEAALGMLLAGYLAGPLVKGKVGVQLGMELRKAGLEMGASAATDSANGSNEMGNIVAAHIRRRA